MHEERRGRRSGEARDPARDLGRVGVGGHRVDLRDARGDRYHLPVDLHFPGPVHEGAPARALRLEADKQHGVPWVRQAELQVVEHAAAGRHPARRDDDAGEVHAHDILRLLARGDRGEASRGRAVVLHVGIELAAAAAVVAQGLGRHGTVEEDRLHGDPALLLETANPVEHFLDAPDRERRDDESPAALHRVTDDSCQLFAIVFRRVLPIAVGGFEEEHVRLLDPRRVRQDRAVVAAEISAEQNRAAAVGRERHADEGRAEQVPRVDELDVDAGRDP